MSIVGIPNIERISAPGSGPLGHSASFDAIVAPYGGDYSSLSDAATGEAAGSMIGIAPGEYTETANITAKTGQCFIGLTIIQDSTEESNDIYDTPVIVDLDTYTFTGAVGVKLEGIKFRSNKAAGGNIMEFYQYMEANKCGFEVYNSQALFINLNNSDILLSNLWFGGKLGRSYKAIYGTGINRIRMHNIKFRDHIEIIENTNLIELVGNGSYHNISNIHVMYDGSSMQNEPTNNYTMYLSIDKSIVSNIILRGSVTGTGNYTPNGFHCDGDENKISNIHIDLHYTSYEITGNNNDISNIIGEDGGGATYNGSTISGDDNKISCYKEEGQLNISGNRNRFSMTDYNSLNDTGNYNIINGVHRSAATTPYINEDINDGFMVGDQWLNETTDVLWKILDNAAGSAAWNRGEYDVVIDRNQYSSDTDAGQALVDALENASIESIFIKNTGTYQMPDSYTINQATSQLVMGEPHIDFYWGDSADATCRLEINPNSIFFNINFNCSAASSAGGNYSLISSGFTSNIYGGCINCKAENSAQDGFRGIGSLINCVSSNNDRYGFSLGDICFGCYADTNSDSGFVNIDQLVACTSDNNTGEGYGNCENLSSCIAKNNTSDGFRDCYMVSSCDAVSNGAHGFNNVNRMSSCYSYNNTTYGFNGCEQISGCFSEQNGSNGFNSCLQVSACYSDTDGNHGFSSCEHVSSSFAFNATDRGFDQCDNVSACEAKSCTYGFILCNRISGCLSQLNSQIGFSTCYEISACRAYDNNSYGFSQCDKISASHSSSNDEGYLTCNNISACEADNNTSHGFRNCSYVSACSATNNGGYGFNIPDYISASYATGNTTGDWSGATNKDPDSCN